MQTVKSKLVNAVCFLLPCRGPFFALPLRQSAKAPRRIGAFILEEGAAAALARGERLKRTDGGKLEAPFPGPFLFGRFKDHRAAFSFAGASPGRMAITS